MTVAGSEKLKKACPDARQTSIFWYTQITLQVSPESFESLGA